MHCYVLGLRSLTLNAAHKRTSTHAGMFGWFVAASSAGTSGHCSTVPGVQQHDLSSRVPVGVVAWWRSGRWLFVAIKAPVANGCACKPLLMLDVIGGVCTLVNLVLACLVLWGGATGNALAVLQL